MSASVNSKNTAYQDFMQETEKCDLKFSPIINSFFPSSSQFTNFQIDQYSGKFQLDLKEKNVRKVSYEGSTEKKNIKGSVIFEKKITGQLDPKNRAIKFDHGCIRARYYIEPSLRELKFETQVDKEGNESDMISVTARIGFEKAGKDKKSQIEFNQALMETTNLKWDE